MKNTTLAKLSDAALVAEVERLARTEHDTTVALVVHLAELGARQLHVAAGFSSLFEYCREVLALSEGEAYNRVIAARAVRRFPVVLERLADGSVNLTTIRLLFKHLTPENHRDLLEASLHKSKRDVERLIAARFPQPAVPLSVRKVPNPMPSRVDTPLPLAPLIDTALVLAAPAVPSPVVAPSAGVSPSAARPARRPATAIPINEDQYNVRFTARAATWDKLQAAQDMLRHAIPSGDVAEIMDRALTLLLDDLARQKFGATTRPRPGKQTDKDSRHIPNAVKRVVWVRDCGRCAFIGASGRRCSQRSRLEFHHLVLYANGGEATVENIQLRCQRHNLYEAERHYAPIRAALDTVREAIPGWDVSAVLSTSASSTDEPPVGVTRQFSRSVERSLLRPTAAVRTRLRRSTCRPAE
jgi:hypothetical protein